MVIDKFLFKNKEIDSYDSTTIDEIYINDQLYNFAKPSNTVETSEYKSEIVDAVPEPLVMFDVKGNTEQETTPTIDNPQPVVSTSDSNLEIAIHSRNLFNIDGETYTVNSIEYEINNGTITTWNKTNKRYGYISWPVDLSDFEFKGSYLRISYDYEFINNSTNTADLSKYRAIVAVYQKRAGTWVNTSLFGTYKPGINHVSATTARRIDENVEEVEFRIYFENLENILLTDSPMIRYSNIMIEPGSNETTYQPYFRSEVEIDPSSGINLRRIGDVYDEVIVENGQAKYIQRIAEVAIESNPTWSLNRYALDRGIYVYSTATLSGFKTTPGFSTHFSGRQWSMGLTNEYNVFWLTPGTITFKTNGTTTLPDFMTWYRNNNVKSYGVLDTPIETDITSTDVGQQLIALSTARGDCTIHARTDGLSPSGYGYQYYKQIRP